MQYQYNLKFINIYVRILQNKRHITTFHMTLHQAWVSNSLKPTTSATKLLSISLSNANDPDSPNWPSGNSIGCSRRTDAGMAFLESLVV